MLASSLLGNAFSLMVATISPLASSLKHTRNTLHYAGTASTIQMAKPKAAIDVDLELRNAELKASNKLLLAQLEQQGQDYTELQVGALESGLYLHSLAPSLYVLLH